MSLPFVHLRTHTEYSMTDGLLRINELISAAAADQQPALTISDLVNLFGLIKFYRAARAKGIKPIAGCDIWVKNTQAPEGGDTRALSTRLLLLVKNHTGYLQLCELLSKAWLENQNLPRNRAEICITWLEALATHPQGNGLIALSGGSLGDIGVAIEHGNLREAQRRARRWAAIFKDSFYIEIQRPDGTQHNPSTEYGISHALAIAATCGLPVVATHPVQFLRLDDFTAHEARTCIATSRLLADEQRPRDFHPQQYFKTQAQMQALFADIPAALHNTLEIAKRCNLTLTLNQLRLPDFPTPEGITVAQYLAQHAQQGLENRLQQRYPDVVERDTQRPRYRQRLTFEVDTIIQMGFPGYFLIVAEFIGWAKAHGIPVGPGRGSGAGSLVAYALDITDLDPLQYHLLFERFLNPERVSMPDFDIDFCQEGRDAVIAHVKERYGKDAVSQIATFGTMAAKGAVRDIGRVLDFSYTFCDSVAKLIPFKPGKHVTIADALKEEPVLAERAEKEEEVKQLLELAQQVEGIARNVGMHAGGVLIAPGKLTDFCPLYSQTGQLANADGSVISQYDKDDVETIGLVKFDFLGLTTLTILHRATQFIRQYHASHFSLTDCPLDDRATYDLLTAAKTVAVFQLESRGMQGMLKEAKPDRFEDIIAMVSLYRPGPMDLIPDFCRRKHGEPFDYPDPRTECILSETYGIMVYQEQVMQMAQVIGGYSLGSADLLRRAMGKKKPEEMAKHRQIFRHGAIKKGLSTQKADEIFTLMEKFAGYGFNKSHAAAYALLSYQTAYLKTHYPAAFMAANLSMAMDDTDKVKTLVEDACHVCQLTLLPPDIHASDYYFTPENTATVRYGLGAIKGTGQQAIDAITAARQHKPFTDLFDFCHRVDRHALNRRTIEALIRAGAFDVWSIERATLLASVTLAIHAAEQKLASAHQISLFDESHLAYAPIYAQASPWTHQQKLTEEKTALGFYLSGHLFDAYAGEVRQFAKTSLASLHAHENHHKPTSVHIVAGIIVNVRTQITQRGKMGMIMLDDGTATIEVMVFSKLWENLGKQALKEDDCLIVQGKCTQDRFNGGVRIIANTLMDLATARVTFGQRVVLTLPKNHDISVATLKTTLFECCDPRGLPVVIRYWPDVLACELQLGDTWRIRPERMMQSTLWTKYGIVEYA